LIADFRCWWNPPTDASKLLVVDNKLGIEHISELRRGIGFIKDNYTLSDVHLAIEELQNYKLRDGQSLVELTLPGAGRDIWALKEISQKTGLNIIAGSGWYIQKSHPSYIKEKDSEKLSEIIIKELTEGIQNTNIRAGTIGEIGCSSPLHENEVKVLRAAALAQRKTGASLSIHSPAKEWRDGHRYIDIIKEEGGNLEKVVMLHMDHFSLEEPQSLGLMIDYHIELLKRGVTLAYDAFGRSQKFGENGSSSPTDRERIAAIVELCNKKYCKQLVVSHDVFLKMHLKKYGGQGYDFILQYIVPALIKWGLTDIEIKNILIDNPQKLLSF
ncbi:MAG: phosphotriesterase, partial [Candidatus Thorarchaeota archaeon]